MAVSDDLLDYTSKIDALVDRIDALLDQGSSSQNRNNLSHVSTFGGFATGLCISACVASVFLTVAVAIFESRSYMKLELEVEQLKAWNDVTRANVAKLQAAQEKH